MRLTSSVNGSLERPEKATIETESELVRCKTSDYSGIHDSPEILNELTAQLHRTFRLTPAVRKTEPVYQGEDTNGRGTVTWATIFPPVQIIEYDYIISPCVAFHFQRGVQASRSSERRRIAGDFEDLKQVVDAPWR
jgi:hypothetical protein